MDGEAFVVARLWIASYFQDFRGNRLKAIELLEQTRLQYVFEAFL